MIEQIESQIVAFLLGGALTFFATRWSNTLKKIDSMECGIQALLRDRILQMHAYYKRKKKPIPKIEVDSVLQMYRAYKMLGGNGFLDRIEREIVEDMPHETH